MTSPISPDPCEARRMKIIAPLLADGLDDGQRALLREQICEQHKISARTLRRYLAAYRENGYTGLKRQIHPVDTTPHLDPALIEQAIILRREAPSRSVLQIIRILEAEELAVKGQIKRSTLQRALADHGFSSAQMRLYTGKGLAARRFEKRHRCQLWQSDIKYGPYLPIGHGGKKQQVFLVAVIDDATRFVVHARFYPDQKLPILEDSLRAAVTRWGKPDALYVDNGKQFRSDWLLNACARLGIKLKFTRPYAPESKGKIERFNRTVDEFLTEAALKQPETLNQLNELLQVWIEEWYHKRPHDGLKGLTPETAFKCDKRPLQFADPDLLRDAFRYSRKAKVDKIGCLKFNGAVYEAGFAFIGRTVEILYTPESLDEIEVLCKGVKPVIARRLEIGPSCGPREKLPELGTVKASSSRLLDAASRKRQARQNARHTAISFTRLVEGVVDNVP
jgi:putative transposase